MKHTSILLGFLLPIFSLAQFSGKVVSGNNTAIPYANVNIKGTKFNTVTDSSGNFRFSKIDKFPFTVVVSYTGFEKQEKQIRSTADNNMLFQLEVLYQRDTIIVTSRRRREVLQDVPISISVISGSKVEDAGAFNVNRVKEFVPSVQLYTSNPRNTGINIRGLGSPFGLTNDGLDQGVGFYVDGVYYARPAAATLDFIDIERIEVLRGPQGTLFGKNTTSGALNITTKKPNFKSGANFELSYGNYGYIQAKSSITGALNKRLAGRLSFSGTQRDGTVENVRTNKKTNDLNNLGFHGQLLYKVSENTNINFSADASSQKPDGYAQVVAGVVSTKRAAYRQFAAITADLKYSLPSQNAFDRLIDHDTPWNSDNDFGGASVNIDSKIGSGTFTSTTAWRYWNWGPSNDRDFTGLQALAKSQNPAKHQQWSQEFRYSGELASNVNAVFGLFALGQEVKIDGNEESGKDQWRFVQSTTSNLWQTPGLLDGYGIKTKASIKSLSAAAFANIDWEIAKGIHVQPGLRFNFDKKDVAYNRVAAGGLQTTDAALLALKNLVYTSQSYDANADENNLTYHLTLSYRPSKKINAFATYSTSFKPVGVNVAGLPNNANNTAATDLAVIKPEYVKHLELGFKTTPLENLTLNLSMFNTDINDYQANVQSPQLGVNRGYIANAEKVNVKGIELDGNINFQNKFSLFTAISYTDGKYLSFTNAPLPLEETGATVNGVQVAFKDISGGALPGISKWAGSLGGEYSFPAVFFGKASKFFVASEVYYRSSYSSSPSPSAYLNIDGYAIVNARLGYRVTNGLSFFAWGRNLFNKDYYEQLLPAGGNAGHYAGVLGDPRTYGITLRYGL
jgi:iron complex outermembrane receptor protein